METKPKTWLTPREAAEHVGMNYPRFTKLAKEAGIPRTLLPGTARTYRYNVGRLDRWMLEHQEGG